MTTGTIRVLDPVSEPKGDQSEPAKRLASLSGKALGLLSNGWRSFDDIVDRYAGLAVEKYEARETISRKNPNASSSTPKETMEELTAASDAALVGVGH